MFFKEDVKFLIDLNLRGFDKRVADEGDPAGVVFLGRRRLSIQKPQRVRLGLGPEIQVICPPDRTMRPEHPPITRAEIGSASYSVEWRCLSQVGFGSNQQGR